MSWYLLPASLIPSTVRRWVEVYPTGFVISPTRFRNLLQQVVEGQVLIQVGCRWEAIFCRRKDCSLGLNGLTIEFPAEKNDFFANFVAFVFCRGKESEGVEVPFRS